MKCPQCGSDLGSPSACACPACGARLAPAASAIPTAAMHVEVEQHVATVGDGAVTGVEIDRLEAQNVTIETGPRIQIQPPPEPVPPPRVTDFVGREAELSHLKSALGKRHAAVITGMAGVGKTALAAEVARQVVRPEHVFWHPFHAGEGVEAIIWQLAAFLAHKGQEQLWVMLESARQTGGQPPPPDVLFDYVFQLIRGHGYLICLDSFQLVDTDPQIEKLLGRLRSAVEAGELVILVTSRRLPSFELTAEVEPLAGLNLADTERLVVQRGLALSADRVAELHAGTGGNAQFLTLAVNALKRARDPARMIGRLSEVDDIERYLLECVDEGLTGEERTVMVAVAVLLGHPGSRAAIQAILGDSIARVKLRRALLDLAGCYLLTVSEAEGGEEEYGQHAIIQPFYYDLLEPAERQGMHERAGTHYAIQEPDRDTLRAAEHFERAGNAARAAELATADVWAMINQGRTRELLGLLGRFEAIQLAPVLWVDVNLGRGQALSFVGDAKPAHKAYEAAYGTLTSVADSPAMGELKARVCRGMGELLEDSAPREALTWVERGLAEVAGSGSVEEAILCLRQGAILMTLTDTRGARNALQRCLDLLPEESGTWRARALMNLGIIHTDQGDLILGRDCFEQARAIYGRVGDHWGMATIGINLGRVMTLTGDWAGAIAQYEEALALAERMGSARNQAILALNLGDLQLRRGEMEQAVGHLTRSLELARSHELSVYIVNAQSSLADAAIQQANWSAAARALEEAERLAMALDAKDQLPEVYRGWALVHLVQGVLDQAHDDADRAVEIARAQEASLEQGVSLRVLGQVLLVQGRQEEALTAFEQSLRLLDGHAPYESSLTRVEWGRALAATDPARAEELLEEARGTLEQLGAQRDLAAVEEQLRGDAHNGPRPHTE